MDLLVTSSLVAAFLAGVAALFAPCCITVLLPTYLASIFKEKRTVFFMTFVFFLGLLTIFLPLGLGVAGLSRLLNKYHLIVFGIGSLFLVGLGITTLLGKHFSLPFSLHPKSTAVSNTGSVYLLGVFSGVGTICCAPVLAGALALSVLPGSLFWGGIYSLAYVLGMVIPLFVIAFFLDKSQVTKKFLLFRRQFTYRLGEKEIHLRLADLISGITFVLMGLLTIYLAATNKLAQHSDYQMGINMLVANVTNRITAWLGSIPWYILTSFVAFCVLTIILVAFRMKKSVNKKEVEI